MAAVTFVSGLLLGCIFTLALTNPPLGRVFLRIFAVLCLAFGLGMIIWPTVSLLSNERMNYFDLGAVQISKPAEAYGVGAGFLLGGGLSLFMSFWKSGPKTVPRDKAPADVVGS